jgi:hypothetical protein
LLTRFSNSIEPIESLVGHHLPGALDSKPCRAHIRKGSAALRMLGDHPMQRFFPTAWFSNRRRGPRIDAPRKQSRPPRRALAWTLTRDRCGQPGPIATDGRNARRSMVWWVWSNRADPDTRVRKTGRRGDLRRETPELWLGCAFRVKMRNDRSSCCCSLSRICANQKKKTGANPPPGVLKFVV